MRTISAFVFGKLVIMPVINAGMAGIAFILLKISAGDVKEKVEIVVSPRKKLTLIVAIYDRS